ncbi:hypothetical protein [Limnospira indica]|uniref:Uncharacterized protein n=1 Tax=Limnospira indica PCC 8005 TaxID=376219 RepID=A0A9P1KCM8_9CYAN|nr:protein of unknown function [Limnospira indica PCC 8005]
MVKDSIRSSTSKNVGRSGGVSSGLAGDLGDQTSSAMDFGRGLPYARERDRAGIPGLVNPWDPITRLPRGIKPEDHGRWKREDDARRIDEEYRRRDVKKEATVKEPPKRDEPKGGKKPKGGSSGGGGNGRSFGGPGSGDKIDDEEGRDIDDDDDDGGEWIVIDDEPDPETGRGKKGSKGSDSLPENCNGCLVILHHSYYKITVKYPRMPEKNYERITIRTEDVSRADGVDYLIVKKTTVGDFFDVNNGIRYSDPFSWKRNPVRLEMFLLLTGGV